MRINKWGGIFVLCLLTLTVAAQQNNGNTKITGDDLLGLKSGADPAKALRGKAPGSSRKKGRPVVFTIGDSTVKNGKDDGSNKQYGWGSLLWQWFDTTRVSVENHALGGRSSRTFITEGLWDKVLASVYRDWETDRKSTRLNSSHRSLSRMPSSA